jgi:hypothetical protein
VKTVPIEDRRDVPRFPERRRTRHPRPFGHGLAALLAAALFLIPRESDAFQYSREESAAVTMAPDTQYRAGWLHEAFFGSHWRDLWATPVTVDVLDLDGFAGGLRPDKRGGGKQTKSLGFRGGDGKKYKFRSIRKDPKQVLPPELRESVAADILQDQISSSHPLAALVVPPLLNAVGVLNAPPRLVYLPNTSKLGEFQEEFGGLLGTIEENPDDPDDAIAEGEPFGGAGKFLGTIRLFEKLEEDNDERLDETGFVKARLMDVFLGDWDRHIDQWRWAGYRDGALPGAAGGEHPDTRRWVPIPRDRDQAFARFDGLFPWIASIAVPQLEGFGDDLPEIEDLTWSGRFLDRRLMNGTAWAVWDSLARHLQSRLTDETIDAAVKALPDEMYALEGEYLARALKIRRAALPAAAREFYELVAAYPDIHASDKREYVEVGYRADGGVDVEIFRRDKDSGGKKGEPFFRRSFRGDETGEIRLYLHGGDDYVKITGERAASTGLVIVGGKGDDEVVDESAGGGLAELPPFTLFSTPAVSVFDEDARTRLSTRTRIRFDSSPARKPASDLEKYEPPVRDYGYDWKFAPWYSISPDEGLFVGGGPILYKHGFRAEPAVYRMQLRGGYATTPDRFRLDYAGDFYTVVPKRRLSFLAEYSQLDILHWFGSGNSTVLDDSLDDADFYKARSRHVLVASTLHLPVSGGTRFALGIGVKRFTPDPGEGTILDLPGPSGSGRSSWYGRVRFEAAFDSRDYPAAATSGILSRLSFSAHHPFTGGFNSFQRLTGEFRTYLTPGDVPVTLAVRAAGEKLWGEYPWSESAFLGGAVSGGGTGGDAIGGPGGGGNILRGYETQRFAGDASVSGSAELRLRLGSFMMLVPTGFGVSVTGETGRVFLEGESSARWHGALGGGIWFSFIGPMNVLSVSVVGSPEKTGVYAAAGFAF